MYRASPPRNCCGGYRGDGQRLFIGPPNRLWAGPSLQFSAQPAPALAGCGRSHPCRPNTGCSRSSARNASGQGSATRARKEARFRSSLTRWRSLSRSSAPSAVQSMLYLPAGVLQTIRARVTRPPPRLAAVVAVRIPPPTPCPWSRWCCRKPSPFSIVTTTPLMPTAPTAQLIRRPAGSHLTLSMWTLSPRRTGAAPRHNIAFPGGPDRNRSQRIRPAT